MKSSKTRSEERAAQRSNSVLLVVQPSASHYREPFLRELLKSDTLNFELVGKHPSGDKRHQEDRIEGARDDILSRVHPIVDVPLLGPLKWQRGLVLKAARSKAAVFVFEGNPYILSSWLSILVALIKNRKIVLWGHGWKRPDGPKKLLLRKSFYSLADAHLLYGDWAKSYARDIGLDSRRFHPIYNSLYSTEGLSHKPSPHKREDHFPTLVFSGRLTKRHEVDRAIKAVKEIAEEYPIRLRVIGGGAEREYLESLAEGSGSTIEFLGPIYDSRHLKEIYDSADYAISPGASGLNVIQALGFATPVIAAGGHRDSGPEVEAVQHGSTGFTFSAGDTQSLISTIHKAIDLPEWDLLRMKRSAKDLVLKRYTAERHATALSDALMNIIRSG